MAKDRLGTLLTYASMLVLALGFSGPAALLGAYSQAPGSPAACLVTLPLLLLPLTRRAQAAWKRGVGAMLLGLAGAALGWFALPWPGITAQRLLLAVYGLALPLCLAPCLGEAGLHGAGIAATVFLLGGWVFTLGGTTAQAAPLVGTLGLVFFPLLLLVVNQRQLREQVLMQRTGRPRGMLPANLLLTAGVIVLAFALGNIRTLWAWLEAAIRWVAQAIAALLALLSPEEETVTPTPTGDSGMLGGLPQGESSPFWKIMEIVAGVALALGAAALLVVVIRRLPGWMRRLSAWVRALLHGYLDRLEGDDRGYVDETVSLPQERLRKASRRRPRLPRHWETLPPAQQVRLAVGWLRRVRQSAPSETARESLDAPGGGLPPGPAPCPELRPRPLQPSPRGGSGGRPGPGAGAHRPAKGLSPWGKSPAAPCFPPAECGTITHAIA